MWRRSRQRTILKWLGLASLALIAVGWTISRNYRVELGVRNAEAWLDSGRVSAVWRTERLERLATWRFEFGPATAVSRWWLPGMSPVARFYLADGGSVGVRISLAWLALLVLTLTAVLWVRDRRPPPGHCPNCAYDLTGNQSGACPECGEPCPRPSTG
jgi:hypothetical protein